MKKFIFSIILILAMCTGMVLPCAAASKANSELGNNTAKIYLDVLQKNEKEILKQDHVPFSDAKTGTVAFLDVTGDSLAELLFLTIEVYPERQGMEIRRLNIYTIANDAAKTLYQGQINFNAVGSQTAYEVYQLEGAPDLYCNTSFSEGSEGTTTYKHLSIQGGITRENVLKRVYHYPDDSTSYFLNDNEISESSYTAYVDAWNKGNHQSVILNGNATGSIAMSYDEAVNYLKSIGAGQAANTTPAPVSVTVNGVAVQWTDAAPFIDENNRTMVPLRAVADALNLTVKWNNDACEASFSGGSKTIYFVIGSSIAWKSDGGTIPMDTAAVIVNDRTYAPIRYLAEYFGYDVGWDGTTRTVQIVKKSTRDFSC